MVLKLFWGQKRLICAFEVDFLNFFTNFWVTKLKPFSFEGKVKSSKIFTWSIFREKHFRKWNWSHFEVKSECFVSSKWIFSLFRYFLSHEVENIFWESRRFQIFSHQKILRMTILENGFEASVRSKIHFAIILAFFPLCQFF